MQAYRMFGEGSAIEGAWRHDVAPYLVEMIQVECGPAVLYRCEAKLDCCIAVHVDDALHRARSIRAHNDSAVAARDPAQFP